MTNHETKPMIFLAFANERNNESRYLRELEKEYRQLKTILDRAEEQGLCQLKIHAAATTDSILDTFTKYRNQIAIFHFAGHANGYQLLLESSADSQQTRCRLVLRATARHLYPQFRRMEAWNVMMP